MMWNMKQGMDRTVKKMKSQSGASLFLALMFFLLSSLAGIAILSIARTYEKRTAVNTKEVTRYLAVLSAAEFVKEQLETCQGEWSLDFSGIDMEAETENRVQEALLESIYDFCAEYVDHPAKARKEIGLNIVLEEDPEENWSIPDVKVKIIFEADGEVQAGFEENLDEDSDGDSVEIPVHLTALFFLEEEEDSRMCLFVTGIVMYNIEEVMEVYWEKLEIGKS